MKNADQVNVSVVKEKSEGVVIHHLNSFQANDLDAVMSDYSNESVLITQDATFSGLVEIRNFLAGLMLHFPKNKSSLELDKLAVNDTMVYIVWHAITPSLNVVLGSDTFIVKEGKIFQQTFVGQLQFIN